MIAAVLFLVGLAVVIFFGDDIVPENAEWFGKTGLSAHIERELPRYLRREFGESIFSPKSLKASDLKYVGAFDEGAERVHYWKVPWGTEEIYANARVTEQGTAPGWGAKRKPPNASQ